jgi:adenosylmethionine---8-amino-7-oxononanoate aminotransferase
MHRLAALDHRYLWHPFTQMRDWLKEEPIVIVRGRGAVLQDAYGTRYLDANSSIWTNLHGHNHPQINRAIRKQLDRIAHSSALGLANGPAALLGEALVSAANPPLLGRELGQKPRSGRPARGQANRSDQPVLNKVFFSDDGSTALEVALKLAFEFSRRTRLSKRPRFLGMEGGYHGDTIGAVSLGHIDLFHKAYSPLLFKTDQVMTPYCYRCRFNRAKPERADARQYRKCNWECIEQVEQKFAMQKRKGNPYSTFVFEPLMQGAAGMIPQPIGWLRKVCEIARGHGALLIADEVMTGFGRTGDGKASASSASVSMPEKEPGRPVQPSPLLFASHQEGVQPDFLALAKGLTGGYVPMAATLTTQAVFDAFLGEHEEFKSFFHGHSFTGNQVGSAAGLASMAVLKSAASVNARRLLQKTLNSALDQLWRHPQVGDIRQVGLVVGVELVKDWRTREPFELREQAGIRVCEAMAKRGVLTRPIGNVIVLMPPYCTKPNQARQMVAALSESVAELDKAAG